MIDWNKPVRFVSGKKPVKLVYTLGKGMAYRRMCVWNKENGEEDGSVFHKDDGSLENVPEKKELWVNVYRDSRGGLSTGESFKSQEDAIPMVSSFNYVATVKVWEEEV